MGFDFLQAFSECGLVLVGLSEFCGDFLDGGEFGWGVGVGWAVVDPAYSDPLIVVLEEDCCWGWEVEMSLIGNL